MSALPRGSRSRSRPATSTKEEKRSSRGSTIPVAHSPKTSVPPGKSTFLCPSNSPSARPVPYDVINMVDTIVVHKALDSLSTGQSTTGILREQSADHSSSLSELDDNLEERDDVKKAQFSQQSDQDDSEAETERINETPRKSRLNSTMTYTPTRLAKEVNSNHAALGAGTIAAETEDDEEEENNGLDHPDKMAAKDVNGVATPSSPLSDDEEGKPDGIADQLELSPRKRKRESRQDDEENDIEGEEPARKRSGGLDGEPAGNQDVEAHIEIRQSLEVSPPPLESVENEEESVEDHPAPVRTTRGKKHKSKAKKGRSRAQEAVEKANTAAQEENTGEQEESGEADAEEEETGSPVEQLLQKRTAFDKFAGLDAAFKALREELLDEQISRLDQELLQFDQNPCQHPEYLAMMTCINARRDEAITKEQYLLYYKERDLRTRFVAERQIIQSQYVQTAREVREQAAHNCYSKLFALQRDRRRWGADDKTYGYIFNPKRSDQIKQQRAYNTEVSLLSGMAKYAGFPGAPEIKGLRDEEMDEDLVKMGVQLQRTQIHPYAVHTHAENWRHAYPMHPGLNVEDRLLNHHPFTPAGQLRQADTHAPNGSASTIDMMSNPPSSAPGVATGIHVEMIRQESSETPLPAQARRFVPGHATSTLYAASVPAAVEHHSPAPNRALPEASTAFLYKSAPHAVTAAEPVANVLRNEMADAGRMEAPLQRMRAAVGAAGAAGGFLR